ncbi:MAG: hypothetical protein KA152_00550 [Verrucomicrobiales bacterium]|nr:hypothetical protein [Verrucomicrobiales bacterium]HQW28209.1 hypothetical protein [Verrucomicrobiales bacterium]
MTIPELTTSLAADSGNWELRLSLVQALIAEGRHDKAVEVVNEGEAIPHEPGPWLAAAKTYAAVGAMEQARGLVTSALEIDPNYEPAKLYKAELFPAVRPPAVFLTADDLEDDEVEVLAVPHEHTIAVVKRSGDGSPMSLPKVAFSSQEIDALREAEEAVNQRNLNAVRRDKLNSLAATVLLHVAIFGALTLVVTQELPRIPPQIIASAASPTQRETITDVRMSKPMLAPAAAASSAAADIISSSATSSFSVSNIDVKISDVTAEAGAGSATIGTGMAFNPSVSLGMPTSSDSRMMFGQPMEMKGEVLGVILDVSGSMAEFLPAVVREVDKNFKDSPVVYVRNMLINKQGGDGEVRNIIAEEVVPIDPVYKTHTPYWFLWYDLPRKAPQRYVDRLIETFKTRPNQFLTVGNWEGSGTSGAIDFLMEQKMDALYIFSDFEDFVDEDIAAQIGQRLGRQKIRTYVQPAEATTEFLDIMTKKISNKTLGRQMPSLVSILRGNEETEVTSLMSTKRVEDVSAATMASLNIKLATPRPTIPDPPKGQTVIHKLSEPEYDAVFYGPEARVEIFLKSPDGYIQNPIVFYYHSWKQIPDHPDPRSRVRRRQFLRLEEEPSFDGKEIIWKMVLEDELKFRVHLYLGRKGMNATYVAEPPKDGTNDSAFIYFSVPALATERADRYYGPDFPVEGVKLDQVREAVKANEVIFNLPRQERDIYATQWAQSGFQMGYNTKKYNELIRRLPNGIRDLVVQGPSFGPRKFHARTTSAKILLNGGSGRADIEPWESFWAALVRPGDSREKFTKTEAIEIEIE